MSRSSLRLALVVAGLTALLAAPGVFAQEKTPTARGTGGAAATVDALATKAAIDILDAGGNAVDAAVAAAGVLGVTEPYSCGIGGGGFMVIRTADGKVTTIDGREKAPAAMRARLVHRERQGARVRPRPLQRPLGRRAGHAARLGAGAGASTARCRCARLLQPAIRVARDGFVVDQTFFDQVKAVRDLLRRHPLDGRDLPRRRRHRRRTSARRCATPTWPRPTG